MFSVVAEVQPRSGQLDAYLGHATLLRPEVEQINGFVENVRYRSLTREGWILSLSDWRNEKALVRWRTAMHHLLVFRDRAATDHFSDTVLLKENARLRQVRVIRDYGMVDRREAPQYFPEQRQHAT